MNRNRACLVLASAMVVGLLGWAGTRPANAGEIHRQTADIVPLAWGNVVGSMVVTPSGRTALILQAKDGTIRIYEPVSQALSVLPRK